LPPLHVFVAQQVATDLVPLPVQLALGHGRLLSGEDALPARAGAEEPTLGPAVSVVVVRDVAHVIVDVALAAQLSGGDLAQARVHVLQMRGGRLGAVIAPPRAPRRSHIPRS